MQAFSGENMIRINLDDTSYHLMYPLNKASSIIPYPGYTLTRFEVTELINLLLSSLDKQATKEIE